MKGSTASSEGSKPGYSKTVVFVVGAPRSGTTWLQSLLSEHPDIVTTGESHLFSGYIGPWDRRYNFEKNKKKPDLGLGILFDDTEMLDFYRSFAYAVMDRIASQDETATVILDKTPNHALYAELILKVFPEAFFINVVRDPRAVVASMTAAARGWGKHWAPKGSYLAAQEWCTYVETASEIKVRTSKYREVRYEALKHDGASILLALFEFIGLKTSLDDCEEYCWRCSFDKQKKSYPKSPDGFYRSGKIDSWRDDLSRSEIRSVEYLTQEKMKEYGYEFVNGRPPFFSLRMLFRTFLSKVETITRYVEDRL